MLRNREIIFLQPNRSHHSESFCAKGASAFGGGYAQDKLREESLLMTERRQILHGVQNDVLSFYRNSQCVVYYGNETHSI
jgi:hypothetical protein